MENAVISKGIKLYYKAGEATDYVVLTDLQEIPELGGEKEAIEITTLADAAHTYTDGLLNYGDSLAFKFLYKKAQFATLNGLEGAQNWKVELPDGASCSFGGACSVKLDGVGTNAALTYTLSIKPSTEMQWA
jgi:hypothetical protein